MINKVLEDVALLDS